MKTKGLWIGLVVLALLVAVPTAFAVPADKPFVGTWESTDIDGSYQKLNIGGGPEKYNLHLVDKGASVCGLDDNGMPMYAFQANGKGTASGFHLDTHFEAAYCMTSPKTLWGSFDGWFDYDPGSDTLWDGWVTWTRISAK